MNDKCMKMTFESKASARKVGKENMGGRNGQHRKLRPYQCEKCHKWHLTSQSKKIGRVIERKVAARQAAREAQA